MPFHSRVLRGGVPDFRARLEELLPASIDPDTLVGRYVPNLVPRPFSLDRDFPRRDRRARTGRPARRGYWPTSTPGRQRPGELCRLVLIELLAWQFASPVRWIETQDLMFAARADGGLGIERIVEDRGPRLLRLVLADEDEVGARGRGPAAPPGRRRRATARAGG